MPRVNQDEVFDHDENGRRYEVRLAPGATTIRHTHDIIEILTVGRFLLPVDSSNPQPYKTGRRRSSGASPFKDQPPAGDQGSGGNTPPAKPQPIKPRPAPVKATPPVTATAPQQAETTTTEPQTSDSEPLK